LATLAAKGPKNERKSNSWAKVSDTKLVAIYCILSVKTPSQNITNYRRFGRTSAPLKVGYENAASFSETSAISVAQVTYNTVPAMLYNKYGSPWKPQVKYSKNDYQISGENTTLKSCLLYIHTLTWIRANQNYEET
jgi:hypothetical protein